MLHLGSTPPPRMPVESEGLGLLHRAEKKRKNPGGDWHRGVNPNHILKQGEQIKGT